MNRSVRYLLYLCLFWLTAVGAARADSLTFSLSTAGCKCGPPPYGTVVITDNGSGKSAYVSVTVTLGKNEEFVGGGAGDALEFNVVGPISITNITSGFAVGPAPDTASTFGTFLDSVTCSSCQGGTSGNPVGPLTFDVSSANGITVSDFLSNSTTKKNGTVVPGYYFASDIMGYSGNTGNVAAMQLGAPSPVPEPSPLILLGSVLFLLAGAFGKKIILSAAPSAF